MGKTLVIAEKPSVARDLAAALPGSFKQAKEKTHLEGDDYVVTWAVGHLVGLAEPDAYDPKLKKWRYADLPIIPDEFKLVPNDDRAAKQLRAIHRLMAADDVEQVIKREGFGKKVHPRQISPNIDRTHQYDRYVMAVVVKPVG